MPASTPSSGGAEPGPDRRRALERLGLGAVGLVAGTWALRPGRGVAPAEEAWLPVAGLPAEVTPVGTFYTVSKNIVDPSVNARTWTLTVRGRVERPYRLTLDELRQLPAVTRPHTLMCISNEVGGEFISNAVWTGVRLRTLLERAGAQPAAGSLILRARDGYADSVPLEVALRDGTMLAYEMNGRPLERRHGFPARVLAMGRYGIKNVKWLSEIEVTDQDYRGYWQTRGWSDEAIYKTFSRIDAPRRDTVLGRGAPSWIGGVAFAGDRGIQAVLVSLDGGASWRPARVKPAMGDHAWALWALPWSPPAAGAVALQVRAVDGTGAPQPPGPKPPLPDGAEGLHGVSVTVQP